MFHAFDKLQQEQPPGRRDWMALLARAPLPLLESALGRWTEPDPRWLRRPETGLMMVEGRAGGSGARFNLGEVTVTRCALRLPGATEDAPVGMAWVLGRHHRQCRLAALADALLQDPRHRTYLEASLLEPVRRHLAAQRAEGYAQAQSTRVDFFTVARETAGPDDEEQE